MEQPFTEVIMADGGSEFLSRRGRRGEDLDGMGNGFDMKGQKGSGVAVDLDILRLGGANDDVAAFEPDYLGRGMGFT